MFLCIHSMTSHEARNEGKMRWHSSPPDLCSWLCMCFGDPLGFFLFVPRTGRDPPTSCSWHMYPFCLEALLPPFGQIALTSRSQFNCHALPDAFPGSHSLGHLYCYSLWGGWLSTLGSQQGYCSVPCPGNKGPRLICLEGLIYSQNSVTICWINYYMWLERASAIVHVCGTFMTARKFQFSDIFLGFL